MLRSTASFQARGARHCFAPNEGAGFSTGRLGTAGLEAGEVGNCFTTDMVVEFSTTSEASASPEARGGCSCFGADTVAGRITACLGARGQGFQTRGACNTVAGRITACLGARGGRDETKGILRATDEGSTAHSTSQRCSTDENRL